MKGESMNVVGKAYSGVSEMIRDTVDAEFSDEFDKHLAERQFVKALTVMRCRKGVTQAELGERMGCGQAKVSKIERSTDADLNLGDALGYVTSLNLAMHLALTPATANGADHIRFHVAGIKHELNRLVKLAGDDRSIGKGVEALAIENLRNLIECVENSLGKLPHRQVSAQSPLCVEVEGERGERLPFDTPKRVRKPGAKSKASVSG